MDDAAPVSPQLLGPDDPAPFEVVNAQGSAPVLFVCDHGSNRVPAALGKLGLPDAELARHIGQDIGAAAVARRLAAAFDAPLVLAGYSRLVIDLNRAPEETTSIVEVVDETIVPGNLDLSARARASRRDELHRPYHAAIARLLDGLAAREPVLVSVHSFTPTLKRIARPWHVGVLWDKDPRLAVPLIARLRAQPGLEVGDNQPYSGRSGFGYTCKTHAAARGLADALIEVRQDLIADPAGIDRWSALVASALTLALKDRHGREDPHRT